MGEPMERFGPLLRFAKQSVGAFQTYGCTFHVSSNG